MIANIWIIPLLPLLGFLVVGLNLNRFKGISAGVLASAAILLSFIASVVLFFETKAVQEPVVIKLFNWFSAGALTVDFSFQADQLASLMLLIVTGISTLIHIYSIGYMKEDEGFNRFFAYLNLFVFFMLLLVLGSNYLILFIGWEGVGLSSYLLIGFWFKNHNYNNAAKKAFIMNRIGDLGFLLGLFLLFQKFGTLNIEAINQAAQGLTMGDATITAATLLLFVGAMGKSAQLPLFTWLPDAMAGPTPVSALIHAATMVTAGIYMIVRSNVLFSLAPFTQSVILYVGIATALVAGVTAIFQNDIKKVLAYSTVSQLGMMFMALGLGAYQAAMFHLTTHAFFKALLFLGAGSVIHAMQGEQDINKMGGLRSSIKATFMLFFIGTYAIIGLPPFAGFFSKDAILLAALEHNYVIWLLGVTIALLTSAYMLRLLFAVFYGSGRYDHHSTHPHESPKNMLIPMGVLAVLAAVGGFMGIPHLLGGSDQFSNYLMPVIKKLGEAHTGEISSTTEWLAMALPIALTLIIALYTYKRYAVNFKADSIADKANFLKRIGTNRFYLDELYEAAFVKPVSNLSTLFFTVVEAKIIDNTVNKTGDLVRWLSARARHIQTGNVGFYIFSMVICAILILIYNTLN